MDQRKSSSSDGLTGEGWITVKKGQVDGRSVRLWRGKLKRNKNVYCSSAWTGEAGQEGDRLEAGRRRRKSFWTWNVGELIVDRPKAGGKRKPSRARRNEGRSGVSRRKDCGAALRSLEKEPDKNQKRQSGEPADKKPEKTGRSMPAEGEPDSASERGEEGGHLERVQFGGRSPLV